MNRCLAAAVAATAILAACAPAPIDEPPWRDVTVDEGDDGTAATQALAQSTGPVTMFALGDVGDCDSSADEKVAAMLRRRSGRILIAGDVAYPDGSAKDFSDCFAPAWGGMRTRLRPSPGNHEYHTAGAAGYFDYFGDGVGRRGRGWYAFNAGPHWRVIVLNSNCSQVGGCTGDSRQGRWLRRALQRAAGRHVLAVFHHPRFSSGKHGSQRSVAPLWRRLYRSRAAIVVNGHEHLYERFAPQNHRGERVRDGIRQFTVGTGGRYLYPFGRAPLPTTQRRNNTTHGFLRLRLRADGYGWRFVPISSDGFTDSGRTSLPPKSG